MVPITKKKLVTLCLVLIIISTYFFYNIFYKNNLPKLKPQQEFDAYLINNKNVGYLMTYCKPNSTYENIIYNASLDTGLTEIPYDIPPALIKGKASFDEIKKTAKISEYSFIKSSNICDDTLENGNIKNVFYGFTEILSRTFFIGGAPDLKFISQIKSNKCDNCMEVKYSYHYEDPKYINEPSLIFDGDKLIDDRWDTFIDGKYSGQVDISIVHDDIKN